ncbi:MAG: hypothetical protein E5X33_28480 [Mesorhizobium sp.]|uniref:hypothetical protein n=1 Tax=Mesorhizobium sp. TaxID=1871066 RepID=UPI000FEA38F5|nr:hypothetical protein [Mesorhizobium sp.]RWI94675.1 MAG: hypothetical protein EOR22_11515 [Mesorhizobium sp.]TIR16568.1 MAG: hypothetical protein E5X33_28480 [Mesorhizobium sp.]
MPRAGGVYSAPPGTKGSPNTTIESAKYNALVDDLVADANAARPITAGGSGSSTAVGGADNLSAAGADMASAATVNLANSTGTLVTITGTVTITALGAVAAGAERDLVFAGALTLTHNATSLILPGGANITTAAGDVARMRSLGGGNWRCMSYQRANGAAIAVAPNTTIVTPTLTLKQSAAPTPTAEGDIQWDTDENVLVIGDGAAQQIFVPLPASVAAGDVFYATGAKALARLAKGTAGQVLQMNAGATAPQWVTPPITKSYESAPQAVSALGLITLAHGFGIKPKLLQLSLICVTAQAGFSPGDELYLGAPSSFYGNDGSGSSVGWTMKTDATNIFIKCGNNVLPNVVNISSGGDSSLTEVNWNMVVRAWA